MKRETRDQITLISTNYKIEKPLIECEARQSKTCSTYVIWSLVSGLFHQYARYENGLSIMLSGLWSLVSSKSGGNS